MMSELFGCLSPADIEAETAVDLQKKDRLENRPFNYGTVLLYSVHR